ncbi:alpha/beta hydrolase [Streptomyces sp. IMTB 2501]|uniref:alpha/beta fold hydrolase n=1 Tax=Streptomyces sp. IMTB 2501 TaxID=1776340 RepID=UPI00096FB5A2|nr:alpha/beta hydrolase [Streptomyces sp. IMTB 2501]OLZ60611.1 alpha/beta hydrolase [Streptomyces sp. IMTB 2501]
MAELHIEQWGSGERTAVLVHGITADSQSWWRTAPELVREGYRVVAVDLPGHGRSPRSDGYSLRSMTDAIGGALPERPALAVGHSLGALLLAGMLPRLQPERVVHVDPAWAAPPDEATAKTYADALLAQKDWSLEQIRVSLPRWEARAQEHKFTALQRWDPATLDAFDGFGGYDPPAPERPSLIVLADPSFNIPPRRAGELRERGFTVRVVPDTGHVVHNEDFDGFWAVLKEWL